MSLFDNVHQLTIEIGPIADLPVVDAHLGE